MSTELFIKKVFWWFCIPFFALTSILCFINHLNPLENTLFLVSGFFLVPRMVHYTIEAQARLKQEHIHEFQAMGATQFLNFMEEFKKIPLGSYRALCKEAYSQEYFRRYNVDIIDKIPMFASK
ncbi:hypothetical protein [Legionella sp. km772]|uniref:hypothetical protein n=1 Tax=Legionella sp. km772 TaxID=2498111 RepID=UPI000F8D768B|nr:hypothetical protein [Legionella sp. km772]RUR04922.1 hypothetical protein ELY15_14965 [Legionella sp. km772]